MAKGFIKLKQDICKACELCASVCPMGCLEIDQNVINAKSYHPIAFVNTEKCIGCARCAIMCPDGVISVYREEGAKESE